MLNVCSLILLFSIYATLVHSTAVTILGHKTTSINFSQGWKQVQLLDGTSYSVTETLGKAFELNLPKNTTSFGYTGLAGANKATYAVCLNCVKGRPEAFKTFQANAKTEGEDLAELFSMDVDPTMLHTVAVYNFPDARFSKTSTLTFVSLRMTVKASATPKFDESEDQPNASISSAATQPTQFAVTTADADGSETRKRTPAPSALGEGDDDNKPSFDVNAQPVFVIPTKSTSSSKNSVSPPSSAATTSPTSTPVLIAHDAAEPVFAPPKIASTSISSSATQPTNTNGNAMSSHDANKPGDLEVPIGKKISPGFVACSVLLAVALVFPLLVALLCFLRKRRHHCAGGCKHDVEGGDDESRMAQIRKSSISPPLTRPPSVYTGNANAQLKIGRNSAVVPPHKVVTFDIRHDPDDTSPSSPTKPGESRPPSVASSDRSSIMMHAERKERRVRWGLSKHVNSTDARPSSPGLPCCPSAMRPGGICSHRRDSNASSERPQTPK